MEPLPAKLDTRLPALSVGLDARRQAPLAAPAAPLAGHVLLVLRVGRGPEVRFLDAERVIAGRAGVGELRPLLRQPAPVEGPGDAMYRLHAAFVTRVAVPPPTDAASPQQAARLRVAPAASEEGLAGHGSERRFG
jgi:hypothetical protein